ncbi:MAG: hypothetical protein EBS06_06765 [Proteobacteria bacterium]|nr:hypothetical protein [Pseudomonadota bacterium]
MNKIKIKSNFTKFLVALTLTLFVLSRGVFVLHEFSHHQLESAKALSSNSLQLQSQQNFFEKLIFNHENSGNKKSENCFLCSFANFQNQTLATPNFAFAILAFCLVFLARKFNRLKLSYLLSSKASRAPPVIS